MAVVGSALGAGDGAELGKNEGSTLGNKEGVYDGVCQDQPEDVNHAVVVVGYGKQTPGGKYWTLRNSWGETFGMDGYFKMSRGKNKCGISDCASFPSVA